MRFALVLPLVLALQVTSTSADTPSPIIQHRILEIDLRARLSAYEKIATMSADAEIELALMSMDDVSVDAKQAMEKRLHILRSAKEQMIEDAYSLQRKIDEVAQRMERDALIGSNKKAEQSRAPKDGLRGLKDGDLTVRPR